MPGAYFPPLDKCLAGEERLTSWKTAYRALSDPNAAVENSALEGFLTDVESEHFLTNSLDPFLRPSGKTKSDFDTKTAPIHVSQSSSGDYDLQALKKDAEWLSEQVKVEELIALRVVLLEWQQRAEDQLRTGHGGNALVSPKGSSSASSLGKSTLNLSASITNGTATPNLDYSKDEIRRERQLSIFLEEKSYILKIGASLINRIAIYDPTSTTGRTWLDKLAEKVTEDQCSPKDARAHDAFCASCIEITDITIQKLDDSTKWPDAFQTDSESKQMMYAAASFTNIATSLQILLANLYMFHGVPGTNTVSSWFKLMAKANFFQDLMPSPAVPDTAALQSLVSIISLTILQAPEVINRIQDSAEGSSLYPRLPNADDAYFNNDACIKELNITLYRAAQDNIPLASPAIYAWSLITSIIRDIAKMQQDLHDQQQRVIEDGSSDSEPVSRRRGSKRDSYQDMTPFEKQFAILQDFDLEGEAREDPPSFLARTAVDRVAVHSVISQLCLAITSAYSSEVDVPTSFIGRGACFELVREGMPMVSYGAEILEAILTILSPDVHGRSKRLDVNLANLFLSDQVLRNTVLDQALARYPFEISPLLRLLSALSSSSTSVGPKGRSAGPPEVVQMLEDLQSMTMMVPEHFKGYTLEHEDENMNSISLTTSLPLFVSKQALSFYGQDYIGRPALTMGSGDREEGSNVLAIPTGTTGVVVKESRPLVFRLEHSHSGLEYLSLLLSTLLPNSELVVARMDATSVLDLPTAAEIITLINALLTASLRQHQGIQEAKFVLGRLGYALPNEQADIISVISDVMETELLAHLDQSFAEGSHELLIACGEFFDKLTEISPERVWTTLSRSCLLGISGGANALAAVVAGTEVQMGRYRFIGACVRMYEHLLEDAVRGLVKRMVKVNKTTNRFDSPMSFQDVTPERTMKNVLGAYETVMVDAWQSLAEWRFVAPSENSEISTLMLKAFGELLKSTYGLDIEAKGISALLSPSATALLEVLAPSSGHGGTLQPLAAVFSAGLSADDERLPPQLQHSYIEQAKTAFEFATIMIRTTRMVDTTGKRAQDLGTQLLSHMTAFASLLATDHSLKGHICTLLTEIVQAINTTTGANPPSLLGQLDSETAKSFLSVISQLDRPLLDIDTESSIWNFLSAVMSGRQQWFATYLLTGYMPKHRLKDGEKKASGMKKKDSVLTYALDKLSDIAELPPERAMAMLKFVASTQNVWVWATNKIRSHPDFLRNVLEWLNGLQLPSRSPNIAEELILANEHQMAAYLCDILAVNLHASLEIGDKTVPKMLAAKLAFLRDHGVRVDAYKRSLHKNLGDNFARKFDGREVSDFERTAANPASFGRTFFYDVDLADKILGHEPAWQGALNGRNHQGFADEFARANGNLSLVEAQRRLLTAWMMLATMLCECAEEDAALQSELAKTVERCLRANVDANLEQPGMDAVMKTRAEMAFVIMSRLVAIKAVDPAMKDLLTATWELVRSSPVDYDVATASGDFDYYRTLLQILYLAIQPHAYMDPEKSSSNREPDATKETRIDFLNPVTAGYLVQIMAHVIAPGFRALCGNLHQSIDQAQPCDFALLTALLQAILSVQGISAVHHQLADVVASTSLIRSALSLYSWSDRLAEQCTDDDPIYGEVAIMFLVSLSTIPSVAEQIAVDRALVQLSSANISNYFRKPSGKGPFADPRRMFSIWIEGFLPLCLNLLDAVGPPITAHVSAFLNAFPQQLSRAQTALENREPSRQNPHAGSLTLSLVSEARSLCLIALILASDTARGAAGGINAADVPALEYDYRKVKADAAGLTRQKTSLRSRIVAVGEREETWRGGAEDVLLGKVVGEVEGLLDCFGERE